MAENKVGGAGAKPQAAQDKGGAQQKAAEFKSVANSPEGGGKPTAQNANPVNNGNPNPTNGTGTDKPNGSKITVNGQQIAANSNQPANGNQPDNGNVDKAFGKGPIQYGGNLSQELQSGGSLNKALGLGDKDPLTARNLGKSIQDFEKTAEARAKGFDGDPSSLSRGDFDALKGNKDLLDKLTGKAKEAAEAGKDLTAEMDPEKKLEEELKSEEAQKPEETGKPEETTGEPEQSSTPAGETPASETPAGGASGGEAAGGAPAGGAAGGPTPPEEGGLEGKDLNGDGKVDEQDKKILELLKEAVKAKGGDPDDPKALEEAMKEFGGEDGKIDEKEMKKLEEAAGGKKSESEPGKKDSEKAEDEPDPLSEFSDESNGLDEITNPSS